jgi:hypothetical protein
MKRFIMIALAAISLAFYACDHEAKLQAVTSAEIPADNSIIESHEKEKTGEDLLKFERIDRDEEGDSIPSHQIPERQKQPGQPNRTGVVGTRWDRKIIRTASLRVEVKEYAAFASALPEIVRSFGGYIAQESLQSSDSRIENIVTIKIPVDQFDATLAALTSDSDQVKERKITSQDVSTEVVDTRSRMEAKRQVRLRYLDLLKQAKNMDEILQVQKEINGVQEEIESAEGRLSYLGHAAAFSTIQLSFFEILNPSAVDSPDPSFSQDLRYAFKSGWKAIGGIVVGLVYIWPLILLIVLFVFLYRRSHGKMKKIITPGA